MWISLFIPSEARASFKPKNLPNKKQTMFLGRKRSVPTVSAWSDPKEHRKGILSVFFHHFLQGEERKADNDSILIPDSGKIHEIKISADPSTKKFKFIRPAGSSSGTGSAAIPLPTPPDLDPQLKE